MTVRLAISVEGQTEERFIKDLIAPHLADFGVYATPVIVATSRSASGKKAKGGGINVSRIRKEIRPLLGSFDIVTSFYDFYGFEHKRPGETADCLEARIASVLGEPRNLVSYVQLHEFEALLLSCATIAADYFEAAGLISLIDDAIAAAGGSPELVDDGPKTAPSKRLEEWTHKFSPPFLRYASDTKVRHGPPLARRLTLPVIRAACPRFNGWITRLEHLPA